MGKLSGDSSVLHAFYKKIMSLKLVVMARSALPSTSKRNVLVCEAVRRLFNCHPDLPIEEKAHHLNNFSWAMMDSGQGKDSGGELFQEPWLNIMTLGDSSVKQADR